VLAWNGSLWWLPIWDYIQLSTLLDCGDTQILRGVNTYSPDTFFSAAKYNPSFRRLRLHQLRHYSCSLGDLERDCQAYKGSHFCTRLLAGATCFWHNTIVSTQLRDNCEGSRQRTKDSVRWRWTTAERRSQQAQGPLQVAVETGVLTLQKCNDDDSYVSDEQRKLCDACIAVGSDSILKMKMQVNNAFPVRSGPPKSDDFFYR
jgi:hypothetical protein